LTPTRLQTGTFVESIHTEADTLVESIDEEALIRFLNGECVSSGEMDNNLKLKPAIVDRICNFFGEYQFGELKFSRDSDCGLVNFGLTKSDVIKRKVSRTDRGRSLGPIKIIQIVIQIYVSLYEFDFSLTNFVSARKSLTNFVSSSAAALIQLSHVWRNLIESSSSRIELKF